MTLPEGLAPYLGVLGGLLGLVVLLGGAVAVLRSTVATRTAELWKEQAGALEERLAEEKADKAALEERLAKVEAMLAKSEERLAYLEELTRPAPPPRRRRPTT